MTAAPPLRREESITLGEPPRLLEARLALPSAAVARGAVVCHPHPQYGGDMDNAVVTAIASALVARGCAPLRFNFGGVGRSQGAYSGGPDEVADAARAARALAARLPPATPLTLVGYSFGAWVALQLAARGAAGVTHVVAVGPPLAFFTWDFLDEIGPPVTFVVGERDQYCPPARLAAVRAGCPTAAALARIAGADHFFVGHEARVAEAVCAACGLP